jgi:chromosome segregation ATPase
MNRSSSNGSRRSQQPPSSPAYLLIFFVFSLFAFMALPLLLPLGSWIPGASRRALIYFFFKRSSASSPAKDIYQPAQQQQPHFASKSLMAEQSSLSSFRDTESRALEVLVMELQRMLQAERERILQLEDEIRVLRISSNFLKERIHSVEERTGFGLKQEPGLMAGSSSIDRLMQQIDSLQRKQESLNGLAWELSKMIQWEKEKTSALASEISSLRQSEAMLVAKVKMLEEKVSELTLRKNRKRTHYAFDDHEDEL